MAGTFRELVRAILTNRIEDPIGAIISALEADQFTKLPLTDGIAEPATAAGKAQLYVDTADGDLKVKFGDGTVKLIVADT